MLEALQGSVDITGNREIADACAIIPSKEKIAIAGAAPVETDLIGAFERRHEMIGIGFVGVAHSEVVDDETKDNVSHFVISKAGHE
jgi:hypothetical protein